MPVHTLGDYKKPDPKKGKGDEKGKPATSYTGGHSSGLAVQNRPDEEQTDGWREKIVQKARDMGVPERGPEDDREAPAAPFGGEGRRLGLTNETPAAPAAKKEKKERQKVVINMWDEGFSLDDGPHRRYDDPANKEFMDKLNKGQVPYELLARAIEVTGEPEVDVSLAPHHGPYQAPEKKFKAFGGGGRTMNDEGPAGMEEDPQPPKPAGAPPPPVPTKDDGKVEGKDIKLAVDNTKPVTTIQVRLLDGTRLQARLNLDHTVGDLRRFVAMAAPNTPEFDLITPFPRTVFSDDNQTIEAAGLKQASVNMTKK